MVLDVREPVEWHHGHIDGASAHPAARDAAAASTRCPTDHQVLVVCKVGGRSAQATGYLVQNGSMRSTSTAACSTGRPPGGRWSRRRRAGTRSSSEVSTLAPARQPPRRRGRGTPPATATSSRARYSRRVTSTTPSVARCGVGHCTSSSRSAACSSVQQVHQRDQRDLRGVAHAGEHRLAGEQAADGHAVQPTGERAVAPRLDRVRPAEPVQLACTPALIRPSIQPSGRSGSAQPATTSANAVSTRISKCSHDWRSERETRRPSRGSTPRGVR